MLQTSVEMVNPGGTGRSGPRHFREPGAFAAEHIFHFSVAIGRAVAERVHVFFHKLLLL